MFRKTSFKKSVIILVALLVCATVVLTACSTSTPFTPVEFENGKQVDGNGGIAVRYGDYIYYVNGYQSNASSENKYDGVVRTGAVVRLKIADLESIIRLNNADIKSSTEISKKIAEEVQKKAELVVPNFYYAGNTTDTSLNGIYIFNDRIYITTPNNSLDANGNLLSSQLVLASYNLGGGDMQRHFVFESNAPQLKLSQIGNDLHATFVLDNKLSTVKLDDASEAREIAAEIANPKFTSAVDAQGKSVADYVYYTDKDGSICQYKVGDEKASVLVKKEVEEGHEGHSHNASYTIQQVNGDHVYYTISSDSTLYCATAQASGTVVLNTTIKDNKSYFGWGEKVVFTASESVEDSTIYHIYTASKSGDDVKDVVDPLKYDGAITFNKLVGNILHFTTNSISYTLDISKADAEPVAYAYSLSTSATGWSVPDVLSFSWTHGDKTENITYVFTLSNGGVSVVKFNPERNNNILAGTQNKKSETTLTVKVEEEEK